MNKYIKLFENEQFSKEFVNTISHWMEFGIENNRDPFISRLEKLKISDKYKKCDDYLYRVMALDKKYINSMLDNNNSLITNIFSSWTLDLKIALNFEKIYFHKGKKDKSVIFKYKPEPNRIFLNLDTLWNDEKFINAINEFKKQNVVFETGIDIENEQKEVILKLLILDKSHILKII